MSPALAARLKEATRPLHTATERTRFVTALIRGELDATAYRALLSNLQALYAALESALARHATHACIAPLHLAPLYRAPALAADLAAFGGAGPLLPATTRYVARLERLEREHPELLTAHAYVRYLGDLSGGQVLRGVVAKCFGRGTAFYEFSGRAAALGAALRAALDALPVTPAVAEAIVGEAREAFALHLDLFTELEAAHPVAAG